MSHPPKHIYDEDFTYVPAIRTDLRKSFAALRKKRVRDEEAKQRAAHAARKRAGLKHGE